MKDNFEQLFLAFKEGDESAFGQLLRFYEPLIRRLANRLRPDDLLTKDIVSESFFKAWKRRKTYESLDHFVNSVHKMTENACTSRWHKVKKEKKVHHEYVDNAEYGSDDSDTEDTHISQMELALEYMGTLPLLTHKIITLYYLEGKSLAQIAALLNMKKQAVATRKFRALRSLWSMG